MIPQYPIYPPLEPEKEIPYRPSWYMSGIDKVVWTFLCFVHALINTILQTWFTWLVYDDLYYLYFVELFSVLWGFNLFATTSVYLFVYLNPTSNSPRND